MTEKINNPSLIGIYADPSMRPEKIAVPLAVGNIFQPMIFKNHHELLKAINIHHLKGLIFAMPAFQPKNLTALTQIRSQIGDLPIVVASESVDKTVKANMGFVGRVQHVDYNKDLVNIVQTIQSLLTLKKIIARAHLRYQASEMVQLQFRGKLANATILDISFGGAQIFFAPDSIAKGDHLILPVPRSKPLPSIYLSCEVVWSEIIPESLRADHRVGLKFLKLVRADHSFAS